MNETTMTALISIVMTQAYNIGRLDGEMGTKSCINDFATPKEQNAYQRGYDDGERARLYPLSAGLDLAGAK